MGRVRGTREVLSGGRAVAGAGVEVRRAFGPGEAALLDPFLLFEDFHCSAPSSTPRTTPRQPFRGLEAITYLVAGHLAHRDSRGRAGEIGPGDALWVTAAGEATPRHEAPAAGESRPLRGFRLWAGLPAGTGPVAPRCREVRATDIPEVAAPEGSLVRVIGGEFAGARGPVFGSATRATYLDVALKAGGAVAAPLPRGHTVFCYVFAGSMRLPEGAVPAGHLVVLGDGDEVSMGAGDDGARFLLIAGRPLHAPSARPVTNGEDEHRTPSCDGLDCAFVREQG